MEKTRNKKFRNAVIVIAGIVVLVAVWHAVPHGAPAKFCFTFVHDTQFGDRKVDHPANEGIGGPNGIMYFLPEVPALQTALTKEGFYIDPYESTGAEIYAGAFFGPSTKSAVIEFQKKYHLEATGEVTNDVIDQLDELYSCATSTVSYASQGKAIL